MFCLDIEFKRYSTDGRVAVSAVVVEDFLLIHGLDPEGADNAARAFEGWAGPREISRLTVDCREDGLKMTLHFPGGATEDFLISGLCCSCLPDP
jgi:hypothetical protein